MAYQKTHLGMFQELSLFLEQLKDKDFIAQIEEDRNFAKRFIVFDDYPPSSYDYGRELSGLLKYGAIRRPSLLDFNTITFKGKDVNHFSTVIGWQESMSNEPLTKGFSQFIILDEEWRV